MLLTNGIQDRRPLANARSLAMYQYNSRWDTSCIFVMQLLGWIPESLVHKIFGILQDVDSSFFCNCFPAKFKDSVIE